MITFEAIQAQHGDSFLLRWGKKLAVIDGGPDGVYPNLQRRLKAIGGSKPTIDLMMVSHIDDDHINGLLALTNDMRDAKRDKDPAPYVVRRFWFNGFEDLAGKKGKPAEMAEANRVAVLASSQAAPPALKKLTDHRAIAVLSSVPQGRTLRDNIKFLGLEGNQPFNGVIVGPAKARNIDGLKITAIGPLKGQLDALRVKWTGKKATPAQLAAYVDKSIANLSSIVCLVEAEKKKILLTGDARGDYVLDGLKKAGLLKNGKLELDLLKLPHHGSDRNAAPAFFTALPAKHYVISANGKYGNPDKPTLQWLIKSRGADKYTIHITNELGWMKAFFEKNKKGRNFTVEYRGKLKDDNSVMAIKL